MKPPVTDYLARDIQRYCLVETWAYKFFYWASSLRRNPTITSVEYLMKVTRLSRREIIGLLKALQEVGCGSLSIGGNKQHPRMEWIYGLRSIGEAALSNPSTMSGFESYPTEEKEAPLVPKPRGRPLVMEAVPVIASEAVLPLAISSRRDAAGKAGQIEIALPDGTCVRVGSDVDLAALQRLVAVLRK